MSYRVSYKHNGQSNTNKVTWGGAVAQKSFNSIKDAIDWINAQTVIQPLKLLKWSDEVECYETIKTF